MNTITLKTALTVAAMACAFASTTSFAQGGNAHGAATAGMTYHGEPVSSPLNTLYEKTDSVSSVSNVTADTAMQQDKKDAASTKVQ